LDPMPGDMADVVRIPIEASCAIQHSYSIYNYCIYGKAIKSKSAHPPVPAGCVNQLFDGSPKTINLRRAIVHRSVLRKPCYNARVLRNEKG